MHKDVYADRFLQNFIVKDLTQLSGANWEAFHRPSSYRTLTEMGTVVTYERSRRLFERTLA